MLGAHLLALACVGAAGPAGLLAVRRVADRGGPTRRVDLTQRRPRAARRRDGARRPVPGRLGRAAGRRSSGTWLPDGTVFVSGREHDGTDGYWVVTPADAVGGAGRPGAAGRARLGRRRRGSAPAPPDGPAELVGWLQPSEGTGARRRRPDRRRAPPGADRRPGPARRPGPVRRATPSPTGAATTGPRPGGRPRRSSPTPGRFTAVRNLLYAIEWWFFGALRGLHLVALGARAAAARGPERRPDDDAGSPVREAVNRLVNTYRVLASSWACCWRSARWSRCR